MMGLPDGWVTDPAIGISRNEQLKACGNGVVPQQAYAAIMDMLEEYWAEEEQVA
jgi:DNA (cytosine-5)-methyltransferase 1